jgi:hypothetical protein
MILCAELTIPIGRMILSARTEGQYFANANIELLPWRKLYDDAEESEKGHGTTVAQMVLGKKGHLQTGVTPEVNMVAFDNKEAP